MQTTLNVIFLIFMAVVTVRWVFRRLIWWR